MNVPSMFFCVGSMTRYPSNYVNLPAPINRPRAMVADWK